MHTNFAKVGPDTSESDRCRLDLLHRIAEHADAYVNGIYAQAEEDGNVYFAAFQNGEQRILFGLVITSAIVFTDMDRIATSPPLHTVGFSPIVWLRAQVTRTLAGLGYSKPKPVPKLQPQRRIQADLAAGPQALLTFGRHKGTPLEQIPNGYLEWGLEQLQEPRWEQVRVQFQTELQRRVEHPPAPPAPPELLPDPDPMPLFWVRSTGLQPTALSQADQRAIVWVRDFLTKRCQFGPGCEVYIRDLYQACAPRIPMYQFRRLVRLVLDELGYQVTAEVRYAPGTRVPLPHVAVGITLRPA